MFNRILSDDAKLLLFISHEIEEQFKSIPVEKQPNYKHIFMQCIKEIIGMTFDKNSENDELSDTEIISFITSLSSEMFSVMISPAHKYDSRMSAHNAASYMSQSHPASRFDIEKALMDDDKLAFCTETKVKSSSANYGEVLSYNTTVTRHNVIIDLRKFYVTCYDDMMKIEDLSLPSRLATIMVKTIVEKVLKENN